MKVLSGLLLAGLTLLLPACATAPPPLPPDPALAALNLNSVAVGPVVYATHQPSDSCTTFIDEDLRSTLVLELRQRGYDAFAAGGSVSRSFSAGSPPPLPGDPLPAGPAPSPGVQGVLDVWIEEYFENSVCTWESPKYLTMGVVGILYAGSPPREVWRHRTRVEMRGDYSSRDLIWLTTSGVAEQLLQPVPTAAGGFKENHPPRPD